MKHMIVYLMVCVCAAGIELASSEEVTASPRVVVPEPVFEFGHLLNTERLDHTFTILNEGEAPLEIHDIRSSSAGLSGEVSHKVIEPGATAVLKASINLEHMSGPQRMVLTLVSNDPAQRETPMILSGVARQLMEIRPYPVFFGQVFPGDQVTREVHVSYQGEMPFQIVSMDTGSPLFEAEAVPVNYGQHYHLHVRFTGDSDESHHAVQMVLETDLDDVPRIEIPLIAEIVRDLIVSPSTLTLLPVPEGQTITRYVTVRAGRIDDFRIVDVVAPMPDIEARVLPGDPGHYRIEIKGLRPTAELSGQFLRIVTDAESMSEIAVPIEVRE